MSIFLLWLTACSSCGGRPESIPAEAGKVTEDIAPDLLTAASPDLAVVPWATLAWLATEDYRDCPLIYASESQVYIDAGGTEGCLDSAGIRWVGSASATLGGTSVVLSYNDFGPSKGVPSPWTALGTIQLTPTASGAGQRMVTRLAVTSHGPGDDLDFWSEMSGGVAFSGGVLYVDHLAGSIGIEQWGTAKLDENRVPLSLTNGCAYGAHAAGTIVASGRNEGVFTFETTSDQVVSVAPPPAATDTGLRDTGDSGGSGGGGGGGNGTDSIPNPTGRAGDFCGVCTELTIDGEPVPGCVTATRTISWPFYDPF